MRLLTKRQCIHTVKMIRSYRQPLFKRPLFGVVWSVDHVSDFGRGRSCSYGHCGVLAKHGRKSDTYVIYGVRSLISILPRPVPMATRVGRAMSSLFGDKLTFYEHIWTSFHRSANHYSNVEVVCM